MSTSLDGKIKLWDIRKGALDYTLYGHNGSTTAGCFSTHGDYFVTGGSDSMVMLWKSNLSEKCLEKINLLDVTKAKNKKEPVSKGTNNKVAEEIKLQKTTQTINKKIPSSGR